MTESRPENAEPASGAWIVFARAWCGLADSFPFERFDDLQDDELPAALEELTREHVEQHGGEGAWIAQTVQAELASAEARYKTELARHHGRLTPPSGRGNAVGPPEPPTKQDLEDRLAAAFKGGGVALFEVVAGSAGWRAPRSRIISADPRTYQPAVYLVEGLSEQAGRLVSQRLNAKNKVEPVTHLRWRFGIVDANNWDMARWLVAEEHFRANENQLLIAHAAEEFEVVNAAPRRSSTFGGRQSPGDDSVEPSSEGASPNARESDSSSGTLASIPALDEDVWVTSRQAASQEGVTASTLRNYRAQGQRAADMLSGIDPAGRVWRKSTTNAHARYLQRSLTRTPT